MALLRHTELDTPEREAYLRMSRQRRGMEADAPDAPEAEAAVEGAALVLSEERYAELAAAEEFLLAITSKGFGKRSSAYEYRLTGRGGSGIAICDAAISGMGNCSGCGTGSGATSWDITFVSSAISMSTGTMSDGISKGGAICGQTMKAAARAPAWRIAERIAAPHSEWDSGVLLLLLGWVTRWPCHETYASEAGSVEFSHDLHDRAVVDGRVAAHKNALVIAVLRNGGEARNQFRYFYFGFLKEDLARLVDRDRQRFLVFLVQQACLRLGQIHGHAGRQQRGRHHEYDQQHEHHVDHRRDVDFGLRAVSAAARTPPDPAAARYDARHQRAFSSSWRDRMAENSSAKPSRRFAILFTDDDR
jgi:hypothetical protein